jgi:hypothetical protein
MQDHTGNRISLLESGRRPRLEGPYVELDLSAIEARAHSERAEYLGGLLRRFWDWLGRDALRARQRRIEHQLSGATDLADLEQRMRALARREAGLLG